MSIVVERIKKLADISNIKIRTLENTLNLGAGIISKWESNDCSPTLSSLLPIAGYFKVSLDYLCGLTNLPNIKCTDSECSDKLIELILVIQEEHLNDYELNNVINYVHNAVHFNDTEEQ